MNTNHDEASAPLSAPDQQTLEKLATSQRRLRWLTGLAMFFWAVAVAGLVGVLFVYSVFISPKEKRILADYGSDGRLSYHSQTADGNDERTPMSTDKALGVHFTTTYIMTKGILTVALSVIVLSCGTLATLLLVIFNRRVTLRQINYSLTQISAQLKELQNARAG